MFLLIVIRLVRYFALLGAVVGAIKIWTYPGWPLVLRVPAGLVLVVAGIVLAFTLAIWAGRLAYEYYPNDKSMRRTLITGTMGPPRSPHDR